MSTRTHSLVMDVVTVLAVDLPRHPLRLPSSNLQDELRLSWRGWKQRRREWHWPTIWCIGWATSFHAAEPIQLSHACRSMAMAMALRLGTETAARGIVKRCLLGLT